MTNPAMDNAQVTGLGELGQYIQHKHNCTLGMRMGKECECGLTDTLARHRLERSEPVGCQYPVHGSVTHVRNVECCDFCGHPADTTTPEPVAEIERLREALSEAHKAIAEYYRYWTGGETRGSYDGKPERNGLWKAMYAARTTLGEAS